MLSDITSDQQDFSRCGHCGEPLNGRFARCPSCHALAADTFDARPAPPPLHIPLEPPPSTLDARLPVRTIWRPLSRDLMNSYEVVDEQAVVAPPYQRLRHSLAISGSMLVVASAVYLGFIHSNDSGERPPIAVSGAVKTQNAVPPIAAGQRQRVVPQTSHVTALAAQQASEVAAQRPAARAALRAPVVVAQQPAIVTTQHAAPVVSQHAPVVVAQQPAIVTTQHAAPVMQQHVPLVVAQQPAIVATQHVAPVAQQQPPAIVAQQPAAVNTTQRPASTASQPHAPVVVAQQAPAPAAPSRHATIAAAQHAPIATEPATRTAAVAAAAAVAATTTSAIAPPQPHPTQTASQHTTPSLSAQRPITIASQRSAPVRLPPLASQQNAAAPVPAPSPAPRRVALLASDAPRNADSPEDKARADAARHVKAARTDLQQNNLSATRTRLAAALAAQPRNRDAVSLRAALTAREQQRDALLSLARGCGNVEHWTCMRHNANTALRIDASSKEAQRLVTLAMREADPPFTLPPPPAVDPVPDTHDIDNHH
ncbi:hypothetical protein LFL96_03480 [Paraburkholderia sp. D15]|uniref:hypothetical protein n=1 Tax=Paraburkholderia sp. D15 TaxID=2880218 RepID=UPI0024785F4A|nr:hypothetical protein [Paraburkholderia sp. D15]WGS50583.1 hypothetical protein LFL96_03480 [Paraburkholderia sp. D15]